MFDYVSVTKLLIGGGDKILMIPTDNASVKPRLFRLPTLLFFLRLPLCQNSLPPPPLPAGQVGDQGIQDGFHTWKAFSG